MQVYKLGKLCKVGSSKRIHLSDYVSEGVPFYRSKEVIELANKKNISETLFISQEKFNEIKQKFPVPCKNDILITSVGTIGIPYLVENENFYFKDGNLTWLRDFDENLVDINFIFYFLKSNSFKKQVLNNNIGAVQKALTIDYLRTVNVNLPIKTVQKKIASVLSDLDKKIELNNQISTTLEQMAKTLYDYWFVQFDFPDDNSKPYKSSGGEMVYNETLKRDIPKGWEVETLDKHISIKRGISYKSHEIQETGTPFLNLNSFYLNGSFKVEGTKFFNGTTKSENLLKTGDLVVAVTDVTRNADIIGKSFIVPNIYEESFLMSCDVAMIKSEKLPNSYLEKLFNSYNYHEYIKYYASGTLVLHLDTKGIGWFETFIPSSNVLKKYDDLVQQIIARKIESIKQNAELTKLRDWLLPMLMNGQVTVQ